MAIRLVRGDTLNIALTVTDRATSQPADLTGATVRFALSRTQGGEPIDVPGLEAVVEDADAGLIRVTAPAADMEFVEERAEYFPEVRIVDAFGSVTSPLLTAKAGGGAWFVGVGNTSR